MAKYTTELRSICEQLSGLGTTGYGRVSDVITAAAPKIFDFPFPLFDEAYRTPLEHKILMHYYTREIGFETYGLFKLKLRTKLTEIMPLYNQYYKSQLLEFNPLYNVDYTVKNDNTRDTKQVDSESVDRTSNTDATYDKDSDSHGADYDLYSATPQGGLTGVDSEEYLTEATKYVKGAGVTETSAEHRDVDERQNTDRNSTVNTTEDYLEKVQGKNSGESYSDLLLKFRETFINIDMMVIGELEELFMGLW